MRFSLSGQPSSSLYFLCKRFRFLPDMQVAISWIKTDVPRIAAPFCFQRAILLSTTVDARNCANLDTCQALYPRLRAAAQEEPSKVQLLQLHPHYYWRNTARPKRPSFSLRWWLWAPVWLQSAPTRLDASRPLQGVQRRFAGGDWNLRPRSPWCHRQHGSTACALLRRHIHIFFVSKQIAQHGNTRKGPWNSYIRCHVVA